MATVELSTSRPDSIQSCKQVLQSAPVSMLVNRLLCTAALWQSALMSTPLPLLYTCGPNHWV